MTEESPEHLDESGFKDITHDLKAKLKNTFQCRFRGHDLIAFDASFQG